MRGWPFGLALWLLVLAAAQAAGFVAVWRFFVHSEHGQLLDFVALTGNSIGQARVAGLVHDTLSTISVVSVAAATIAIGFIAVARRRVALGVGAVLLIAGSNATTQYFKELIYRPHLGIDVDRVAAGNSLPSGHTTVAASVVVALVLVVPPRTRGLVALGGAVIASLVGVATLSAGWHRPSDAVAALLVVGAWAAAASLFILIAQRRHGGVRYGAANTYTTVFLALVSIGLLLGAVVALRLTDGVIEQAVDDLSRRRLFVAYAGGALGIAGTAGLVVSAVLATAHRVVPLWVPDYADEDPEPEPDPSDETTLRLPASADDTTVPLQGGGLGLGQ
ncbi:phosphatase PAP2 family protein [Dactylosporangium sp. NPDC049140]|uniref:phosphatase PAP2 family protein n=1 Tax=Dactylosporangium sp. NPDC049140 TaxID=3155647 RepID=UPI0033C7A04D